MEITRNNLRAFREDFNNTLKSLQEDYEVTIDMGNITYGGLGFHFKVDVTSGNRQEAERNKFIEALKRNSWKYPAFDEDSYGKVVKLGYNKDTYRIVGIKPRSRKYPIVVLRESDEKRYKYTYEAVLRSILVDRTKVSTETWLNDNEESNNE